MLGSFNNQAHDDHAHEESSSSAAAATATTTIASTQQFMVHQQYSYNYHHHQHEHQDQDQQAVVVVPCSSTTTNIIAAAHYINSSTTTTTTTTTRPAAISSSVQQQLISSATQLRQMLMNCAQLVARSDFISAASLISLLSSSASPSGDSTDRLVLQFTRALALRLHRLTSTTTSTANQMINMLTPPPEVFQSSFLSLNQITPFIRFSHLTANQAILDALGLTQEPAADVDVPMDNSTSAGGEISHINDNVIIDDDDQQQRQNQRQRRGNISVLHILDFDAAAMQGVQWPPLMQALAERNEPISIRITGTGPDLESLRRTGARLETFAHSLGLNFQFRPLLIRRLSDIRSLQTALDLRPDEALAVNCVLHLHKLQIRDMTSGDGDDDADLRMVLRTIRSLRPKVVTVAEREAAHSHPSFLHRFGEAVEHYGAIFESLEATVPPGSREREAVEQVWLGREISDIVAAEGEDRKERHRRFEWWARAMGGAGFSSLPLSPFAFSQARALLKLHYPSEGYHLQLLDNHLSFFLGWQNRPLFFVSSWR